jgi:hypothetical protein
MEYYVHNTSRAVMNRLKRYEAASHKGLLQLFDDRRVVRGRPLVISEEDFIKNIDALKQSFEAGYLEVRTADGRLVDLNTGEVNAAAPVPPLPVFVPDSVKNDKPSGIPMPIYPGGAVQSLPTVEVVEPVASEPVTITEDIDDDVELEHTESGSGIKKSSGSSNKKRR